MRPLVGRLATRGRPCRSFWQKPKSASRRGPMIGRSRQEPETKEDAIGIAVRFEEGRGIAIVFGNIQPGVRC